MASSSSSASNSQYYCPPLKNDVFLNFSAEDTGNTFAAYLYKGLENWGIVTFKADKTLKHGYSVAEQILKAIEVSQFAVVIFSKHYARSIWCLNEMMKIMECKDKRGLTVIPVFYHVDPSHVRNQRECFAEAFAEHEFRYQDDVEGMQKVQGWRTVLTAAANLKGYDIRDRLESDCCQEIVNCISSKLCKIGYSLSFLQDVRLNTHLEKVKFLLEIEIDDVLIVGISGMGGFSKMTVATAIFHTLSYLFEAASLLLDIKENEKKIQLHSLQNVLLSDLLGEKDNYVKNKHAGKFMISSRPRFKKVLIVLDDIDHSDKKFRAHLNRMSQNPI